AAVPQTTAYGNSRAGVAVGELVGDVDGVGFQDDRCRPSGSGQETQHSAPSIEPGGTKRQRGTGHQCWSGRGPSAIGRSRSTPGRGTRMRFLVSKVVLMEAGGIFESQETLPPTGMTDRDFGAGSIVVESSAGGVGSFDAVDGSGRLHPGGPGLRRSPLCSGGIRMAAAVDGCAT